MFMRRLTCDDTRFKSLNFRDGLNIILAEKAADAEQGDSRNSTGKSSLVAIIRFLMGGSLLKTLDGGALSEHSFTAVLELPSLDGPSQEVRVTRSVARKSQLSATGWDFEESIEDVNDWRQQQAKRLFQLPDDCDCPTVSQLWGQLARTYFDDPTKQFGIEAHWETGCRIGYLLGLSPEILQQSRELVRLRQQHKALKSLDREQVFEGFTLDEAALRSELAVARTKRDTARSQLDALHIDERYAEHQSRADSLSQAIQEINDQVLINSRLVADLEGAAREEQQTLTEDLGPAVEALYAEANVNLPGLVTRRFEEVAAFHRSVVRNRQRYLREGLDTARNAIDQLTGQRQRLDTERAETLRLLTSSVAMETLAEAQRSLVRLESQVAQLEQQLENATKANQIGNTIKLRTAETVAALQTEIKERERHLERPLSRFSQLGDEIYKDRRSTLRLNATPKGNLAVTPKISGDDSIGIKGVETFLLDIVCLLEAIALGRSPKVLVHDSHIFDATDDRQVASCLNIGARLAEEHGFQYIVTMNSDKLESAQREGAFDGSPYILETRLSDATDDGGLFGFRF